MKSLTKINQDSALVRNYDPSMVFDLLDVREATRSDYKARIGLFIEWLDNRQINPNTLLLFKRYLSERTDLAVSTKNKYLTTAKIFLRELSRNGVIPDITHNIKVFQQEKKHKKDGLNDNEIEALSLRLSNLPETPQNTRIKAIVSLLIFQGLRQIEITRLNVSDIDLKRKVAFVQGKGRDDKEIIYLHPKTVRAIKGYLRSNKIASGPLFQSQSNNSKNQRLTTRAIRGIIKDVLNELGIEKSVHGFRHYFTTKLIKHYGGDLLRVQNYTRHNSVEMLQVYNDEINMEADLPNFYKVFEEVRI